MHSLPIRVVRELIESPLIRVVVVETIDEHHEVGRVLQDGLIEVDQVMVAVVARDRGIDDLDSFATQSLTKVTLEVIVDRLVVANHPVPLLPISRHRLESMPSPHGLPLSILAPLVPVFTLVQVLP